MKRKIAKFLCLSLALNMFAGQTIFADEIGMSGEGSATGTSPSEFSVADAESSAVVRLPANLDLDFSEELGAFQVVSNVGVYGDIKDFAEISVSIDEDLIYSDGVLNENLTNVSNTMTSSEQVISETANREYQLDMHYLYGSDTNAQIKYYKFEADTPLFFIQSGNASISGDTTVKSYYLATLYQNNIVILSGDTHSNSSVNKTVKDVLKAINFHEWYRTDVYNYDGEISSFGPTSPDLNPQIGTSGASGYDYTYLGTNAFTPYLSRSYNIDKATIRRFGYFKTTGKAFPSAEIALNYLTFDADDYNYVTGKVLFGENAQGICTETWSSSQAAAGLVNHDINGQDDTDYRTIMVNVPSYEVTTSGHYYATAEFDINFTCIGMKSDISATTKLSGKEIEESDYGYAWDEDYTSTTSLVNLGRMGNKPFVITTSALKDNTSMQGVKYLQLADNTTTSYLTYIDDEDSNNCNSWIMGMHGLQVLVIPKSITTEQLHKTAGNTRTIDGNTTLTNNNSITAVFDETNTKIGNALAFVKNIDANGKFIYVPHICYRGTKEEFKALSGFDNWVFGNKGNIITVHCTDGIMYY